VIQAYKKQHFRVNKFAQLNLPGARGTAIVAGLSGSTNRNKIDIEIGKQAIDQSMLPENDK
jgi:hypothetical protein